MGTLTAVAVSDLKTTYKAHDAWWTVLLVDPLAVYVLRAIIPLRWVTPNVVTVGAFIIGVGSAVCFALASTGWLIAGAILYHLAFVLDCVDGKLARWRGSGSFFGGWLDLTLDRVRVLACTVALMGGQYAASGRPVYLYLAVVIVFLDQFRQLNGVLIFKARAGMRDQLEQASLAARPDQPDGDRPPTVFLHETIHAPEPGATDDAEEGLVVDLHQQFRSRFRTFVRLRDWLVSHRIRPHVFSGIEFQMAVLIVAPLTGLLIAVPVVAAAALLVFELAITYKFLLSTRDFRRALAVITGSDVPSQRADTTANTATAR